MAHGHLFSGSKLKLLLAGSSARSVALDCDARLVLRAVWRDMALLPACIEVWLLVDISMWRCRALEVRGRC